MRQKNLPEDILEALGILKDSEKSDIVKNKVQNFIKGIEALSECINEYPEHEKVIDNYKHSCTRSLISYLYTKRPNFDPDSWLDLVFMLFLNIKNQTKQIIEENPELGDYLEEFVALWSEKTPAELKGVVVDIFKE